MSTVAFVACSKTKRPYPTAAGHLYVSALFRKSMLFALTNADRVYILSAKHGVLELGDRIAPYDVTLGALSGEEKRAWARSVEPSLKRVLSRGDTAVFLAGAEYQKDLVPIVRAIGARVQIPLGNLSLGRRLQYLTLQNGEDALAVTHRNFYRAMKHLYDGQNGGVLLSDATGRMPWPSRGMYFFFDPPDEHDEIYSQFGVPRITRVGTHAVSQGARSTLWNRLSTHRGTSSGQGSHRSSIFRLHVGRALSRENESFVLRTWGVGQVASAKVRQAELHLERAVTEALGRMKFLWLDVADPPGPQSDRSYLERNAIGLLSRYNVMAGKVPPSWLGNRSTNSRISMSGLWNLNHLFEEPDVAFIKVLQQYIEMTLSGGPATELSLAPKGWHNLLKTKRSETQLSLFSQDAP